MGFEPIRFWRQILSLLRLPFRHKCLVNCFYFFARFLNYGMFSQTIFIVFIFVSKSSLLLQLCFCIGSSFFVPAFDFYLVCEWTAETQVSFRLLQRELTRS